MEANVPCGIHPLLIAVQGDWAGSLILTGSICALQNFDEVLVPADHVSRNPNDTYYVDPDTVLRCHTSAHQAELLRQGEKAFLVTGDLPCTLE